MAEFRGRSEQPQQSKDNQHLSVSGGGAHSGNRNSRSVSLASTRTAVEENPDVGGKRSGPKRRQTQVAVVHLTWRDCLKGLLLGPKWLKQKLAADVELAELEDAGPGAFDNKDCPFIVTVTAFPCRDSGAERQEGQCLIDTGCLQGNIISAKFARSLGFSEFQPLKGRELNGGKVATGQIHTVSGAIHVSWLHSTSTKVFRDMRFLVSETADVDLLIGGHSIWRHGIIPLPNFEVGHTNFKGKPDPKREKLAVVAADLRTTLEDLNKDDAAYKGKKKDLKIAELKLALYDAGVSSRTKQSEDAETGLKDQIKGLEKKLKDRGVSPDEIKNIKNGIVEETNEQANGQANGHSKEETKEKTDETKKKQ